MTVAVLVFLASGAGIFFAGKSLAERADAIADQTGLGRLWIGALLLAMATSLPEVATAVSAVRIGAQDLAAGNLFGACLANMMTLAVIDLLPPRGRVLHPVALDHALSVCLAILLSGIAVIFVLLQPRETLLGVGLGPVILFGIYLAGMNTVFRQSQQNRMQRVPQSLPLPLRLICAVPWGGLLSRVWLFSFWPRLLPGRPSGLLTFPDWGQPSWEQCLWRSRPLYRSSLRPLQRFA